MEVKLASLQQGEKAVLVRIEGENRLRRRLTEMGFIRGSTIRVDSTAPFGDPRSYVIRGYQVSLRNLEAAQIVVETTATEQGDVDER